jgi:hypothetical protein
MIRGIRYSRPLATVVAATFVAACAAAWHREVLVSRIAEQRRQAAALEEQISGPMGAMEMYSDERLRALRKQVGLFRVRLGGAGTWGSLVSRLGQGWTSERGPAEDRGGYSIQLGTFKLLAPSTADWPRIVDAVKASEGIPGVRIVEFEMKASGDLDRRSLDLVRILMEVQSVRGRSNEEDSR